MWLWVVEGTLVQTWMSLFVGITQQSGGNECHKCHTLNTYKQSTYKKIHFLFIS